MSVARPGRAKGGARSVGPHVATVMVADLSGSTPLGERLDPEELRTILAGFFRGLSHEIRRYGGSVDKYIGDAVRAIFDGETAEASAVPAIGAGQAMLDALAKENQELERRYNVRLSLRIGVNTGEMMGAVAGEEGRARPSVGRTVTIAQRLESTAIPNTVHVGDRTYRAARRAFRFEAAPLITIGAADDMERAYRLMGRRHEEEAVPPLDETAGAAGQDTGASLQVGEQKAHVLEEQRKVVTVLFADLAEPLAQRLEPEALRHVLGIYFSAVSEQIRRYGGTIDKYIGDAVMAVFGAPISHEDDAGRAIHAALGIQNAIRKENDHLERQYGVRLVVRIGVNTGEVVAGLLAGEVLAYTVTGDAVNTAQRIESATPAEDILVSDETYALARKSFEFEPVPALTLKGKSRPVAAYRVCAPLEIAVASGPPLVGRGAELERLATLFRSVQAGRGAAAHIHGEAGVGKSRVLAEFVATLPPHVERIAARSGSYEAETPYALVANLLRRWVTLQTSDDVTTARVALHAALGPLRLPSEESAIELVLDILGYAEGSAADPESKRRQLTFLLRRLLLHRGEAGVFVLTFEDLHWIDSASSAALADVFGRVAELRCLVLTVSRDEPVAWPATPIALAPLDAATASEMVDRVAAAPLDEKVRALILERTGGNPFFIEEVVRALGSGRATTVPATVQDLLEAKLDALDASPKHVAQGAAVVGRTFWTRVVARISPDEEIRPALATLEQERFVAPYQLTPEETYAFRHALVQEVVYATQLIAQRRRAHAAVGGAILELFADRLEELTDVLAYHFGRSDDDRNARRYLLLAGQRAQRLYANDEALSYYAAALGRSADDPPSRAAAREGIGAVQRFQGKLAEAIESFEQAIAALGDTDARGCARLEANIAAIHRLRGERERALDMLSTALATLPDDADGERALVYLELAETHWLQGGFDAAIASLELATAHAERAGATEGLAEAYKHLGTVHTLKGEIAEGLGYYERSLALFEQVGDLAAQGKVLNNIGIAQRRRAHYDEALKAYARSLEIKERLGDPLGIGAARNNVAQVHRLLGELDQAEAEYRASLEQFELLGVASGIALAHSGLGSNALDRGDRPAARQHFLEELAASERLGQRASLAEPQRSIA